MEILISEASISSLGVKLFIEDRESLARCQHDEMFYLSKIIIYAKVSVNNISLNLNSSMTRRTIHKKVLKVLITPDSTLTHNDYYFSIQKLINRYMKAGIELAKVKKPKIIESVDLHLLSDIHQTSKISYNQSMNTIRQILYIQPGIDLEDLQSMWSEVNVRRVMTS